MLLQVLWLNHATRTDSYSLAVLLVYLGSRLNQDDHDVSLKEYVRAIEKKCSNLNQFVRPSASEMLFECIDL